MVILVDSEGPDQTARMRSLIWAFAVHIMFKDTFSHGAAGLTLCAFSGDDNLHVYVNLIFWEKKKKYVF